MTASAQLPGRPFIDLRCGRTVPGQRPLPCQLYVGHEGPHAVLFARGGERILRTWTGEGAPRERPAAQENLPLPWVPGAAFCPDDLP